MGSVTMQFLIAASLLIAGSSAQLVIYPNGAIAPFDPNNAAATREHLEANAEAGKLINPYGVHTTGIVVPHAYAALPHGYGKREANLVTYPNGAVTPFDPNVAAATAQHYAAKAAHGHYPFAGAANVHPAGFVHHAGFVKREAQLPVNIVTGFAPVPSPYFGLHHIAPVVAPFTAHPNGALVPAEPAEVVEARAEHLAAHAAA